MTVDPLPSELPIPSSRLLAAWREGRTRILAALGADAEQLAHDEGGAAASLPAEKQQELQRRIFLMSRQLGLKAIEPLDVVLEPHDITVLLRAEPHPCFSGTWSPGEEAGSHTLVRAGCGHAPSQARCDYWREAVDGLVMGLGDDARFARHRSMGHGDAECVDVWYEGASSPLQLGPVPDVLTQALEKTSGQLAASGVVLTVQGFSEGTLYYRLRSIHGPACGPGGVLLRGLVKHALDSVRPGLSLVETTPQGVLGSEA